MNEFIGKTVIVGLSFYDEDETLLEQQQFHGEIVSIDPDLGIQIVDSDGGSRTLPPRPEALLPALPGIYREYSTGETIEAPDIISSWHVQKLDGTDDDWSWLPYKMDLRTKEE